MCADTKSLSHLGISPDDASNEFSPPSETVPASRALLTCRDEALFTRDPVGRCFVHRAFVMWRASRNLSGIAFWGTPAIEDAAVLVRLLRARHTQGFMDVATITDTRGLVALPPDTLEAMLVYVAARTPRAREQLGRLFALLDATPASTLVYGVNAAFGHISVTSAGQSYLSIFEELGVEEAAGLARTLEHITANARAEPRMVAALRAHIIANLASASVATASRALGVSARSLQRALASAGTSFVHELQTSRVRQAASLLTGSDWKIERISAHVGFSSVSHFRTVFQQERGVSPSAYRTVSALRARRGG
jgi:AraC-like DNA-binding protein